MYKLYDAVYYLVMLELQLKQFQVRKKCHKEKEQDLLFLAILNILFVCMEIAYQIIALLFSMLREYEKLRRKCLRLAKQINESFKKPKEVSSGHSEDSGIFIEKEDSPVPEDLVSGRQSISIEETSPDNFEMELQGDEDTPHSKPCMEPEEEDEGSSITHVDAYAADTESSGSESSAEESEKTKLLRPTEENEEIDPKVSKSDSFDGRSTKAQSAEDIATWQRIIRLDAIRANAEWVIYSPSQAAVSEEKALELAEAVGLKDYDHLEPCRIFHAARLVAILEAYALYDAEIGYCQGMSDLLSPIIAVIEEDYEAFWCFVGFMRKARHNFRLDEVGIRRQLNIVSKIIKSKDSQLYRHLEKLQAEDCFFVYRMVVVLFRRELDFEQTLCLWEVMWADQAAIRAGIGKSAWGRVRMRAPPTEDLLLYAIAACVLQRRKLIIERYSSMDEILRECNSMVGQLDVWKLLDDAHVLVVTLHDKI
ncbi:hypothetical protein ACLOJK_004935 [Asimina triloba]